MALETCLEGVAAVKSAWGFSVYPLSLLLVSRKGAFVRALPTGRKETEKLD